MRETYLTRADTDVGEGDFDSIAWAFSEHVKLTDPGIHHFAILTGNEDSPKLIEFFTQRHPQFGDVPNFVMVDLPDSTEDL